MMRLTYLVSRPTALGRVVGVCMKVKIKITNKNKYKIIINNKNASNTIKKVLKD